MLTCQLKRTDMLVLRRLFVLLFRGPGMGQNLTQPVRRNPINMAEIIIGVLMIISFLGMIYYFIASRVTT